MASGKRQATTDINRDNWDQEDEPEERGTFRTATEEELKKRVIKKARRSAGNGGGTAKSEGDVGAKSIFSGFSGFGNTSASTSSQAATAPSPFSFISKMPTAQKTSGISAPTTSGASVFSMMTKPTPESERISSPGTVSEEKSKSYYAKLMGLNQAVSNWIKTHVDKNPLCILTPVFNDYEKYLKNIESAEDSVSPKAPAVAETKAPSSVFTAFKFTASPQQSATSKTSIFATSTHADPTVKPAQPFFSFSPGVFGGAATKNGFGSDTSAKSATTDSTPIAVPAPFSFGNIQPPPKANDGPSTSTGKVDEEENDEPPKVEFKKVVEKDAIYSKKCKLFIKKDGKFSDRGVGTIYLKPIPDSTRVQLLVRADTNLGNILANIVLNEAIPAERMGKNNVMLVCLPTADAEKPTPMLLRVKTADEADELLEIIKKHKN